MMVAFSCQGKQELLLSRLLEYNSEHSNKASECVCACTSVCVSVRVCFAFALASIYSRWLVVGHVLLVSWCVRVSWTVSQRTDRFSGGCEEGVDWSLWCWGYLKHLSSACSYVPCELLLVGVCKCRRAPYSLWHLTLQQHGGLNVPRLLITIQTFYVALCMRNVLHISCAIMMPSLLWESFTYRHVKCREEKKLSECH